MKKTLLVAMLLIGALMMVFANGDEELATTKATTAAFQVPAGGYDGSDVTITFYHTMGTNLNTVLDEYIKEFNQLYPNIHVVWTQVGSYDDVRALAVEVFLILIIEVSVVVDSRTESEFRAFRFFIEPRLV